MSGYKRSYKSASASTQLKKMRAALAKAKAAAGSRKSSSAGRKTVTARKRSRTSSSSKGSGAASAVGGLVGSLIGGSPGAAIGKGIGSVFSKITGVGDYKVSSNSIMMGTDPPAFDVNGRGTIVRHREYIQDISGSTAFASTTLPINPGMANTFPWLSSVAQNYEEYVIRGMVFEFKSTSATALNSTNTALGTVIMCTRYNALAPSFTSKVQMENYQFCTSTKPSDSALHPIECAVGESPLHCLYTRAGPPGSGDLRMYDLGFFQISTVGMQAAAVIGELWVTYDVELLKPKVSTLGDFACDHIRLSTTNYGTTNPFGDTPAISSESSFGCAVTGGAGTCTILFPDWPTDYSALIVGAWVGTSTTITVVNNPTYPSALTRYNCWSNNTSSADATPASTTAGHFYTAVIKFTASGTTYIPANRTITWNSPTGLSGFVGGDIWISQVSPPLTAVPASLSIELKEEKKDRGSDGVDPDDPTDDDGVVVPTSSLSSSSSSSSRSSGIVSPTPDRSSLTRKPALGAKQLSSLLSSSPSSSLK